MKINLSGLLNGNNNVVNVEHSIDFTSYEIDGLNPINKVDVIGNCFSEAGIVNIKFNVKFDYNGTCDRCAELFNKKFDFNIEKIAIRSLENENDDDEYIIIENDILDIDEFIYEEVILFLPHKMLCHDDCKGLCPSCGVNLNYDKCECKREQDPRLAILNQLLDNQD